MRNEVEISIATLHGLFHYNPESGALTNRVKRKMMPAGIVSGFIEKKGYRSVRINGGTFKVHRVAWAMFYGKWPDGQIDHANRDKLDNRIANLREASGSSNQQNKGIYATNSSGFKGVNWHKRTSRWHARVMHEGTRIYIGSFSTKEDAAEAYRSAAKKLHREFFANT